MADQKKPAPTQPATTQSQATNPSQQSTSPSQTSPLSLEWVAEKEQYLLKNGWEMQGRNEIGVSSWRDPGGSLLRPVRDVVVELPLSSGGHEVIKQMNGPPIPWTYSLEKALEIQQQRDQFEGIGQRTPLERLDQLEAQYSRLSRAYESLMSGLDRLIRRPTPDKPHEINLWARTVRELYTQTKRLFDLPIDSAA